ncbi:hypothetical protein TorRG33x02_110900 [Trema orientale]|uniref:Uncharacterized protein n=1 Tax=Trema orientale TaxID=63057 RepID=A0A2P5F5Y5_TREOI|nr:hypothetical protein TorRG33x02_110900 [Trema orientale]
MALWVSVVPSAEGDSELCISVNYFNNRPLDMNYYDYAEPLPWEFATVAPPLRYQIPCYPSVDGWPLPYRTLREISDRSLVI